MGIHQDRHAGDLRERFLEELELLGTQVIEEDGQPGDVPPRLGDVRYEARPHRVGAS